MKETEAKERIIKYLYSQFKENNGLVEFNEIVSAIPETDLVQVSRICKDLQNHGYIKIEEYEGDDGTVM